MCIQYSARNMYFHHWVYFPLVLQHFLWQRSMIIVINKKGWICFKVKLIINLFHWSLICYWVSGPVHPMSLPLPSLFCHSPSKDTYPDRHNESESCSTRSLGWLSGLAELATTLMSGNNSFFNTPSNAFTILTISSSNQRVSLYWTMIVVVPGVVGYWKSCGTTRASRTFELPT